MIRSKVLQLAAVAALIVGVQSAQACSTAAWTGAATTATSGQPNTAPANSFSRYSGICSLKATAVGQFVTDGTPAADGTYNALLHIYTGGVTGGEADFFRARNAGGTNIVRVTYDGSVFRFYVNGTATTQTLPAAANTYYAIRIAFNTAGTFDARIKGNSEVASTAIPQITGFTGGVVDEVQFGWIAGGTLPGGARAPNFDEFDSRRNTLPSFLCLGDADRSGGINIVDRGAINQDIQAQAGVAGTNLAAGQPDANRDGIVNIIDRGFVNALIVSNPGCTFQ